MPRDFSNNLRRAVNAQETDEVFCLLLTMIHPDLEDGPIRVTDDGSQLLPLAGLPGIVSRGNEFTQYPFEFMRPGEGDNQSPASRLKIDNVERTIIRSLRSIRTAPEVLAEVILRSDPDHVEYALAGFRLTGVNYTQLVVEGFLTIEQFENEPFPGNYYLPSTVPGIF